MYEDLRSVLRPRNEISEEEEELDEYGVKRSLKKSSSVPSFKASLRKLFGMHT